MLENVLKIAGLAKMTPLFLPSKKSMTRRFETPFFLVWTPA